jgi:hypothetical protein
MGTGNSYRYFVFYWWRNEATGKEGYGCTGVNRNLPVCGIDDIVSMRELIEENNPDLGGVLIVNWRRFEDEE